MDVWPVIGKLDNVADLKKRTRSYNSSITFLVCTPTEQNGKIWKQFLKSSKGYWHFHSFSRWDSDTQKTAHCQAGIDSLSLPEMWL